MFIFIYIYIYCRCFLFGPTFFFHAKCILADLLRDLTNSVQSGLLVINKFLNPYEWPYKWV